MGVLTARAIADNCKVDDFKTGPHHPLYCDGWLRLYEDNSLACPHTTHPYDFSTQSCIDYSFALLLVSLACDL